MKADMTDSREQSRDLKFGEGKLSWYKTGRNLRVYFDDEHGTDYCDSITSREFSIYSKLWWQCWGSDSESVKGLFSNVK
jgi:hypothetical protein